MMEYWVAFMRDGRPSGKELQAWQPYTTASPKTMIFGNEGISLK
jgi:carboxylesterase type B